MPIMDMLKMGDAHFLFGRMTGKPMDSFWWSRDVQGAADQCSSEPAGIYNQWPFKSDEIRNLFVSVFCHKSICKSILLCAV